MLIVIANRVRLRRFVMFSVRWRNVYLLPLVMMTVVMAVMLLLGLRTLGRWRLMLLVRRASVLILFRSVPVLAGLIIVRA